VLDRDTLVNSGSGKKPAYLVPGQPEKSFLWIRTVKDRSMPPEDTEPMPTDAERKLFEKWIAAGAPFPSNTTREYIPIEKVLTTIRNHLQKQQREDRPYQRY